MSKQRPMTVEYAVDHAAAFIERRGFVRLRTRRRTLSRYLRHPHLPFKVRVSDHAPVGADRFPDVLRTVLIREPMTQDAIEALCVDRLADFDARVALRLAGISRASMRHVPTPSEIGWRQRQGGSDG